MVKPIGLHVFLFFRIPYERLANIRASTFSRHVTSEFQVSMLAAHRLKTTELESN